MKKKIIPIIIAIVLIIVIAAATFGKEILDKYSYSDERYDLTTYFENTSDEDTAIIMDGKFMTERAIFKDGAYYVSMETALTYFNDRFYHDGSEDLILYALPEHLLAVREGEAKIRDLTDGTEKKTENPPYRKIDGEVFLDIDFLRLFSEFGYEAFEEPRRLCVSVSYAQRTVAEVKKDSAVRHRGGVKSEILKDVKTGEKLIVLEQMEEWSKVLTNDGLIGYIENKHLENVMPELPIPEPDEKYPGYDAEFTSLTEDRKIVLGFHAVAGIGGNDTLYSVTENAKGMNVICPTWFKLTDNLGNFESFADTGYVEKAHGMGLEVWGLAENIEHAAELDMEELLSSRANRQTLIENLITEAETFGLDGINIDFEMLPTSTGEDFSEFIRELSIACRKGGYILSIDNYVPIGGTGYYDRKTQGQVADYLVIMGYDEHYAGSAEAGSVASIGYVEAGITMTIDEAPANKVINAVPFYTRIWETDGADVSSQAVDMATATEWLATHGLTPEWDEETCQNYASYTDGNKVVECWLEDAESLKVRLNIMNKYELGGLGCWRLGFETPDIWETILTEYAEN